MNSAPPVALILFSNDLDRFLPNVERERKAIEEALEHFDVSNRLKVITRSSVSIEEIFRLFARYRGRIVLFHFAGHATGEGLQLTRNFADQQLGQASGLAELFRMEVEQGKLQLVFLNGCSTQPQVEQLKAVGLPSIIATRHPINDEEAYQFAQQFYQRLANTQAERPFESLPTLSEAYQHALSYLMTQRSLTERKNQRGLTWEVELEEADRGATWQLFSQRPDWQLPNDPIAGGGEQQIVIQNVSDSSITIEVDGHRQEINKRLDDLMELLQDLNAQQFQTAGKAIDRDALSQRNFDFIVEQARADKSLPEDVAEDLIEETAGLIESLKFELQDQGVSVSDDPGDIIQYFGWLIEENLRKMLTPAGQAGDLRAFSFMTEAFQASLRYLCLIQMAQMLRLDSPTDAQCSLLHRYLHIDGKPPKGRLPAEHTFDYLTFFIQLMEVAPHAFVPEMLPFSQALLDTHSYLYGTALFLDHHRRRLLRDEIPAEELPTLIPQYLTGLTSWLSQLAFLANYRLLSVKDVNLSYKLGFAQSFVHFYGELHGMYDRMESSKENKSIKIEKYFTYNQSVLLIKGRSIDESLQQIEEAENFLSLSPLVIDQSVFDKKPTQTPEIYFYTGQSIKKAGRKELRYHFALYKNELPIQGQTELPSNKDLHVAERNINQPKLNELYKQLSTVLQPFYAPAP